MSYFYDNYLCSDYWSEFRKKALAANGGKCMRCNKLKSVNVHHLSYKNLYHEVIGEDVVSLCSYCHKCEHHIATELDRAEYLNKLEEK